MTNWIIKSETDDSERALAIVEDQRTKGYTAWIEDEHGTAVDEQSLKTKELVTTKRILPEWVERPRFVLGGPLFVLAFGVAGLVVLYLIGLWVDR